MYLVNLPFTRRHTNFKLCPKLKASTNHNSNVTQNTKFFFHGVKHCGETGKCSLLAFLLFPTMFSLGFFLDGVISCHCMKTSRLGLPQPHVLLIVCCCCCCFPFLLTVCVNLICQFKAFPVQQQIKI